MRESKLTIWTLIICFTLLTAYFCTPARADDSSTLTEAEITRLAGMCYVLNVTEPDKELIADWWMQFLITWTGSETYATGVINTITDMTDWNQVGTTVWNDALEACANSRYDIIKGMEEYAKSNADT